MTSLRNRLIKLLATEGDEMIAYRLKATRILEHLYGYEPPTELVVDVAQALYEMRSHYKLELKAAQAVVDRHRNLLRVA